MVAWFLIKWLLYRSTTHFRFVPSYIYDYLPPDILCRFWQLLPPGNQQIDDRIWDWSDRKRWTWSQTHLETNTCSKWSRRHVSGKIVINTVVNLKCECHILKFLCVHCSLGLDDKNTTFNAEPAENPRSNADCWKQPALRKYHCMGHCTMLAV